MFKHGKNAGLRWNALDLTPYITDVSLDRSIDLSETTTMSTTSAVAVTRIAGISDGKVSITLVYDPAIETTVGLETDFAAGTSRTLKYQEDTTTTASTTNPSYSGTAFCTSFKRKATVKDKVTATAEFAFSGAITRATAGAW